MLVYILKTLARGLFGRLLGYGAIALGFWLLFQGFLESEVLRGLLGGALIPLGMYLLVLNRSTVSPRSFIDDNDDDNDKDKEEKPGDSLD